MNTEDKIKQYITNKIYNNLVNLINMTDDDTILKSLKIAQENIKPLVAKELVIEKSLEDVLCDIYLELDNDSTNINDILNNSQHILQNNYMFKNNALETLFHDIEKQEDISLIAEILMENKYPLIEKHLTNEQTISEPIVIDVRTSQELKKCEKFQKIRNHKHIPFCNIPFHLHELVKYQNISVICRSGNRSQKIVNLLKECENKNALNVQGGFLKDQF